MNKKFALKHLQHAREESIKKYGDKSAVLGNERIKQDVIPTGSLMLDYKMGTGGIIKAGMTEVFGANNIGKTSAIGYSTIASAQKMEILPAIIAMEPEYDPDWAFKLAGVDPELLLLLRPDNAQEAFEMLYDLVYNTDIGFIMLDSIGAMADESTQKDGAKVKAFGVSGTVTSGLNAVMPRLWKNEQSLMIINQQRQGTGGSPGMTFYESPGGQALKHHARVRIQVKPGSGKYYSTIDGEKVLVGRELKCVFKKNKAAQATDKSAEFAFYNIFTEDYGLLGIDKVKDYLDTGLVSGAIVKAGGYYQHEAFPDGKVQGIKQARKFFEENPQAYDTIRKDVMERMAMEQIIAAKEAQEAEEVIDGG